MALEAGRVGNRGQGRRHTTDPPLEARSSRPEGIWISLLTDMSTTRYRSLCFPKNKLLNVKKEPKQRGRSWGGAI